MSDEHITAFLFYGGIGTASAILVIFLMTVITMGTKALIKIMAELM